MILNDTLSNLCFEQDTKKLGDFFLNHLLTFTMLYHEKREQINKLRQFWNFPEANKIDI